MNKGKLISGNKCYLGPDMDGQFKIVEIVNIHCKKIPVKYVYKGQYCSIYIKSENGLNVRRGMVLIDIDTSPPNAVKTFEAQLWTIDGTKKIIKNKYQPVLNIKHVRQGCKIRNFNEMYMDIERDESTNVQMINKIFNEEMKSNIEFSNNNIEGSEIGPGLNLKMNNSSTSDSTLEMDEAFSISSTSKTKLIFEFMFSPEYVTVGSHIIINDQLIKAYGIITKIYK